MNILNKHKENVKYKEGDEVIVEEFKNGRHVYGVDIGDICIVDQIVNKSKVRCIDKKFCDKSSKTQCIKIYNAVTNCDILTCVCKIRKKR